MRPIIGLTSGFKNIDETVFSSIDYDYIMAVSEAGGLPITLPIVKENILTKNYMKEMDGLIFTGGEDISPLLYGENPISQIGAVSFVRDKFEMCLFKSAREHHLPIMGICRGMQLINVALGGTLYQDINKQIEGSLGHRSFNKNLEQPHHKVSLTKDSRLYTLINKKEIGVNSFHHQSVKEIGKDLKAVAYSNDGIIEAIESVDSTFVLGMQWHPERMTHEYPMFKKIFELFISACK